MAYCRYADDFVVIVKGTKAHEFPSGSREIYVLNASLTRGEITILDRACLLKLSQPPKSKAASLRGLFHFK